MSFEINVLFEERAIDGLRNDNPDVMGGLEYRINGRDPFHDSSRQRPTTWDFLGMGVRSALEAAADVQSGDVGYAVFYEWSGYLAFEPAGDGRVQTGASRTGTSEALEAVGGDSIDIDGFVNEVIRVSGEFLGVAMAINPDLESHPRIEEIAAARREIQPPGQ